MTNDTLRTLDKNIATGLRGAGLVDSATILGETVDGYYVEEFDEQGSDEDAVAGLMRTFDCRVENLPVNLAPEDIVDVSGYGQFRYIRSEPYGNGRVLLLLGTQL